MTDTTLFLIACGGKKRDRAMPAKDLYTGDLFRKARAYAEAKGGEWLILSALHGVVQPDRVLEPYDARVPTAKAARRAFNNRLASQLYPHREREIVCLAGEDYCGWIECMDERRFVNGQWVAPAPTFPTVSRPLKGLGIGEQLAWLKAALEQEAEVAQ